MNPQVTTGQMGTMVGSQPLPSIVQSPAVRTPRKKRGKKMGEVPAAVAAFRKQMKV